ncbi:nuclear transport factor 2 family protein [Sphingobium sp. HWE2-09]|uniref:nuclear transport factor 2 family protein n=1 Tax=Sphingobium sp. HWE2-09 TaxID=3108390 RepID=UPI002DC14C22|nr:nuclear transport factor 2 family protein [Sphingobium sp. HWE2-09]
MRDWDQMDIGAALTARETERRDALLARDRPRLADLLSDDLVHVHTSGQVHDKAQLLHHAIDFLEFIDVTRGPLTIRPLAPDAAVMTGTMTNIVRARGKDERVEVRAFVTQVWVRQDGQWRIASFHACRLPQE